MPSISESADVGQSAMAAAPDQSAEAGPSSAPQTVAVVPTPVESSKPKPIKKPKGKAKANVDGATDGKPARTSLRGGMIGIASSDPPAPAWLPAGGGARKALPELVLPFKLPTSVKGGEDGDSEESDGGGSEDDEESSEESETEGDGEAARRARLEKRRRKERRAIQRSLLQNQALRQSRLFHLASLLTPYSRRTKAGVSYPASLSPDLLHGIEPSVKGSHVLTPLSRVEVQVGPHFFAKTKLWEMRKEKEPRTTSPPPPKKTQPAAPTQPAPLQQASKVTQPTPAPRPVQPPQPPAPRPAPPTAAATAAVDPVLVTRVNERASKDADLRDLLQVAARGAASPEQLRVLGEVIQDVTREMERDGLKVQPPQAIARAPPPPPVAAPVATPTPKAQPKAAKGQAKKITAAGTPSKKTAAPLADSSTEGAKQGEAQHLQQQAQAPLGGESTTTTSAASATAVAPAASFRPPILVMEFRENPSMRFYLPLWSSIVRRRKLKRARDVGDGGAEEEEELPEEPAKDKELIEVIEVQLHFLAPLSGSDAAIGTGGDAEYPILMTITAEDSNRTIWEAIGRVPGVRTLDATGREVFEESKAEADEGSPQVNKERKEVEELETTIAKAIATLPRRRSLNLSAPLPRGLEDHLADKFAPQLQSTASLYSSSSSREPYHHGSSVGAGAAGKRRSSPMDVLHDDLHDLASGGGGMYDFDGSLSLGGGLGGSAPKPKKKRNVATHNPDGSVKRCNSCQTNVTPMWRRGPEGPATLCNACGARWKSGRLGMPSARGRKGSAGLGESGTAGAAGEGGTAGGSAAIEAQSGGQTAPASAEPGRVEGEASELTQAAPTTSQHIEVVAQTPSAPVAAAVATPVQTARIQGKEDVTMTEAEPEAEAELEADASANTSGIVEGTL